MNKVGMLANLIGTFVVILVGVSIIPVISQQIDAAINCNSTIANITEAPRGPTGSFGGAGGYHFGGYDGEVKHKSFLSQYSIIQTNSSIFNSECQPVSPQVQTVMGFVPMFFAIGIVFVAIGTVYNSLRQSGQV